MVDMLDSTKREKLNSLYHKVFDDNNNIKVCGRKACIDLINFMQNECGAGSVGNAKTGVMNVSKMQNSYELLTDLFR